LAETAVRRGRARELELHPGLRAALAQRGVGLTDPLFSCDHIHRAGRAKCSILLIVHRSLTMVAT
jgi:hypothetical protein